MSVSVSAFRARSMGDAVFAGTLAAVEELVTSPLIIRTSSISEATEDIAVLGLFALGSVPFSGVEAIWFG